MRQLTLALTLAVCASAATTPTFNKEVLPILQNRCQDCHRPGEIGPMALLSYQDARPWAKSIRQAVLTKKMPPWFADPHYGKFLNDRSLSQAEIDTLVAWVDAGAPEGNPKDAPAPRQFVEGWNIGKPDLVIQMPNAFEIPAKGVIDYQYVVLPTHLTEDKWVVMSEVVPSDRSVVHHVITSIREPGSTWFADAKPGVVFVPAKGAGSRAEGASGGLSGYVPGQALAPAGFPHRATLLKAGSDIVFQLHYTTNGKATTDRTKIGLIFAKGPVESRVMGGNSAQYQLNIPAGDPDYHVEASSTMHYDCDLVSMMPHAHYRAKAFEYRVVHTNGDTETVLKVPNYDYHWQLTYYVAKPIHLEKGAKVEVIAEYDNSAENKYNPDPTKEVHWGLQTFDEMMMGYFSVVVSPGQAMPEGPQRRRPASTTTSTGAALE